MTLNHMQSLGTRVCRINMQSGLTLYVQGPNYSSSTEYISFLLMPWLLASPRHQHPWYWLCRLCKYLSYARKDFCVMLEWRNDRNGRYAFMFTLNNSARKWLILFECKLIHCYPQERSVQKELILLWISNLSMYQHDILINHMTHDVVITYTVLMSLRYHSVMC